MKLDFKDNYKLGIKKEIYDNILQDLIEKKEGGQLYLSLPLTVDQLEIVVKALKKMKKKEGLDYFHWQSKCIEYLCADYLNE